MRFSDANLNFPKGLSTAEFVLRAARRRKGYGEMTSAGQDRAFKAKRVAAGQTIRLGTSVVYMGIPQLTLKKGKVFPFSVGKVTHVQSPASEQMSVVFKECPAPGVLLQRYRLCPQNGRQQIASGHWWAIPGMPVMFTGTRI